MIDLEMVNELMGSVLDPKGFSEYSERNRIEKTKVGTLTISTVETRDLGLETAIIDKNGVHPVQRYICKAEAEKGHNEWIEKVKTINKITKLGYPGIQEDYEVTLSK